MRRMLNSIEDGIGRIALSLATRDPLLRVSVGSGDRLRPKKRCTWRTSALRLADAAELRLDDPSRQAPESGPSQGTDGRVSAYVAVSYLAAHHDRPILGTMIGSRKTRVRP
jgi:hypothetical protein